jgi:4a-hydroxytetrahydrobiopterin dehydratase
MDLLTDQDIDTRLDELEGWDRDGTLIVKTYDHGDFIGAIEFVKLLVAPAEDMNHHPDLNVSWSKVTVTITTHAAGGLTENDFVLAKRIEALTE